MHVKIYKKNYSNKMKLTLSFVAFFIWAIEHFITMKLWVAVLYALLRNAKGYWHCFGAAPITAPSTLV
jgi:hypothetical protein